jgi:hypothetical protein
MVVIEKHKIPKALKSSQQKKNGTYNDRIVKNMRDCSNEPFFLKKRAQAKEFLDRVGLPDQVINQTKKDPAN